MAKSELVTKTPSDNGKVFNKPEPEKVAEVNPPV